MRTKRFGSRFICLRNGPEVGFLLSRSLLYCCPGIQEIFGESCSSEALSHDLSVVYTNLLPYGRF